MGKVLDLVLENARVSSPKKKRSNQWAKVRANHLKKNGSCAACGSTKKLEVHHIVPFSDNPELELDPNNLITLCENAKGGIICHLCIGHKGDYKDENPNVVEDAKWVKERIFTE